MDVQGLREILGSSATIMAASKWLCLQVFTIVWLMSFVGNVSADFLWTSSTVPLAWVMSWTLFVAAKTRSAVKRSLSPLAHLMSTTRPYIVSGKRANANQWRIGRATFVAVGKKLTLVLSFSLGNVLQSSR